MKKLYGIILLLFTTISLFSQTDVSGTQSGTWTAVNSPYNVTGNITIPSGQTLTIEAGVTVNFQGHYRIYVNGKIIADGTQTQPILFTTNDTDTGWGGLRLDGTPNISIFHYCKFEHGKTDAAGSYPDQHGGAFVIKDANAEFYNCIFENNDATGDNDGMGGAVYCMNTGSSTQTLTKFIDCTFQNNYAYGEGGAIKFTNDGKTEITGCKFFHNSTEYGGGAILFYTAYDVTLTKCLFFQNFSNNSGGGAIKTLNPQTSITFNNCTFTQNSAYGNAEGGAVDLSYADAVFVNSIIYNNYQQYGKDINIGMNASADINYCDVNMPDNANGANNIETDPLFVDEAGGDYHLSENSPCIDAGTDIGLEYVGDAPDMGCYEYGMSDGVFLPESNNFLIFPNPSDEYVKISGFDVKEIVIFDLAGKEVLREKEKNIINVSALLPGTYFMKIKTDNKTVTEKFVKIN